MKITRRQLRRIIKEELGRRLRTENTDAETGYMGTGSEVVPADSVSQTAAQTAASKRRGYEDPTHLIDFLDVLDEEQMEYTGKRFLDPAFEEFLAQTGTRKPVRLIRSVSNDWSGFRESPPVPFPEAGPNVAGRRFAGFARIHTGVFHEDLAARSEWIAKFFEDFAEGVEE